ncbi:hypothetical protein ABZS88_38520 [Streptomyces sp. NPDC005480]|uniref:hypothetical protein n=1 Tax=Streptomyces sp. NPDC005480 TaxID=3154880 RepID=UPI0033A6776F
MSQAGVEAAHVLVRAVLVLLVELDDHDRTQDSTAARRRVEDVVTRRGSSSPSSLVRISTSRPDPSGFAERANDLAVRERAGWSTREAAASCTLQSTTGLRALQRMQQPPFRDATLQLAELGE